MAAMAPALTDAPSEARHIRLKLAAESNSASANLLLSSSVSPAETAGADGRRLREGGCRHCCNGTEPLRLGKLQPLVASYLCSHVAPVAEEGVLIKPSALKRRSLLNGDLLLHKALNGGQPKGLANGGAGAGGGGGTMVPVNALAKKVAVPSTALPEKGSVATVNGNNAKPPSSARSLLQVSSKSGGVASAFSVPNGDSLQEHVLRRVPESTNVNDSPMSPVVRSKAPPGAWSHSLSDAALKTNCSNPEHLDPPNSSAPHPSTSPPSSGMEALLLRERVQQSQRRQADVSVRLQHLCKRLQVVQAKQVERHVRQQLTGFLHTARTAPLLLSDGSVPPELETLHMSGATNLRAVEALFDSDATESSSGGESDVEEAELARADAEQRHVKLWRRAEGRFALDRASIISRWAWLQAHISDLEYRIRQQSDILQQIRASKGVVQLENVYSSEPIRTEQVEEQVPQNSRGDVNPASRCDDRFVMSHRSVAELSDDAAGEVPKGGCSAARVRALISCKRRRLIQPGTFQSLNSKVPKMCRSQSRRCDVNPSCVTCGSGWYQSTHQLEFQRPLLERVSLLDYNTHPSLSLQSDVSLGVHLQKELKWAGPAQHTEKLKPLKKLPLRHKIHSAMPFSPLSRHKFRLSSSHRATIRLTSHKGRSERSRKHQNEVGMRLPKPEVQTPCRPGRVLERSLSRRRSREDPHERTETEYPKLRSEAESSCTSQPSFPPTTPTLRQMCQPSDSSTPLTPGTQSGSCSVPIRKRRGENSFDINNIVIPMSVAATTRVEKLQYKEIITPSWREVDVCALPLTDEDNSVEVEDVSDSAFTHLHQRYEDQERSRWRWNALTPAKRRGSRSYKSLDGRTTPSLTGTTPSTPQPSSPDIGHFHVLQDYGPFPSPLSPPSPDTPCSRDAHMPSSKDSYSPQTRDAQRLVYGEDTRCSTPDLTYEEKTVHPWECRSFPLSEEPAPAPKMKPRPHQRPDCRPESESEPSSP